MTDLLIETVKRYREGDLEGALAAGRAALTAGHHEDASLLALIGNIHLKRGDRLEAAEIFARAAQFSADKAAMFLKLAVTLFDADGHREVVMELGPKAVALNPADAALAYLVASAFFAADRIERMAPLLAHLDRSDNRHLDLLFSYYSLMDKLDVLLPELETLLAAEPGNSQLILYRGAAARALCDFKGCQAFLALMAGPDEPLKAAVLQRERALGRLAWSDDEALQARESQDVLQALASLVPPGAHQRRPIAPAGRKLKIGYLSFDFFAHATMTLLLEVLEQHDTDAIDFYLLSYASADVASDRDSWPEKLRDRFVDLLPLPDNAAAAAAIDALGIDILVDLKGHTLCNRLAIVNRSTAPLKVTWLGYPGTVGGVDLDYAISDPIVTPDTSAAHFHERLCRLPETYQPNGFRDRPRPPKASRADYGLPDDAFVFASFNNHYKITPARFELWAEILARVPGSLLWCLCDPPAAADNLRAAFAARGIDPQRIVIARRVPYADNLARAGLCDLGLDTAPYNGHTTTSDMLWAGTPVVATWGQSFVSRVSASLLRAIGLPELVAADDRAYVDLAIGLAGDPARLRSLRDRLAEARFRAPLFDAERFARHLEAGFEAMAARARAGLPPALIDVPALPPRTAPFHAGETW